MASVAAKWSGNCESPAIILANKMVEHVYRDDQACERGTIALRKSVARIVVHKPGRSCFHGGSNLSILQGPFEFASHSSDCETPAQSDIARQINVSGKKFQPPHSKCYVVRERKRCSILDVTEIIATFEEVNVRRQGRIPILYYSPRRSSIAALHGHVHGQSQP
jgi:hypothetical protein